MLDQSHLVDPLNYFWFIQCCTTGVIKAVICTILSVGWCILVSFAVSSPFSGASRFCFLLLEWFLPYVKIKCVVHIVK